MTDHKKCYRTACASERGNAAVITFVLLLIVAAGIFAYKSGKMEMPGKGSSGGTETADASPAADKETNPILAKLYGEEITRQEVLDIMNGMPPQLRQIPPEQLFPMALEQMINNRIIDKKASRSGLERDPDVKKQLAKVEKQLVRTKYLENLVKERMTEDRIKTRYDEYVKNFPEVDELKVAHILVDDEKLAKSLIKKLNNGEEFATLAKENSKDGSAANGGDLGYFSKNDVVKEFADAAFAMKIGTYSKKPVKSDFGYHIIRVDEKRKRPPAEYEEAKGFIEQDLSRVILDETIREMKKEVDIERFDINGNPLPEQQEPAAGEGAEAPEEAASQKSEKPEAEKAE